MCPDTFGQNNNNDNNSIKVNENESKGEDMLVKEEIDTLTKRSLEIRYDIENLINSKPSLLNFNRQLQSRSTIIDRKQKDILDEKGISDFNFTTRNDYNLSNTETYGINAKLGNLSRELVIVNENLIRLVEKISTKYKQQKEFINIAAHEIRSPCQAIMGYLEMLNMEPANSKRYQNLIARNAERLDLLISNILDASRFDNKIFTLKKKEFNLVRLVEETIEDVNNRIISERNKNIEVIFEISKLGPDDKSPESKEEESFYKDILIIVKADKERLVQVIFNLLDNAIRFTNEGKIIVNLRKTIPTTRTEIKSTQRSNTNKYDPEGNKEEIVIQVKDPGKGIDSKIFPRLFSKFASDLTTTGGTGLGLFISKNIIEAHGGKIWAENNKNGKGASFYFTIPICMD